MSTMFPYAIPDNADEVVEYVPRFPKQLQAQFAPKHSRTLFVGGVGFGKTLTLGDIILEECCNYPDAQAMVAGATKPSMKLATIAKVMEEIRARNVWVDYKDYLGEVYFSNGSWFKFQSLDVARDELEGSELNALVIDEITGCDRDKVMALLNRVRRQSPCSKALTAAVKYNMDTDELVKPGDPEWWDYSRRVLLCGNPPAPGHWLEEKFIQVPDGPPPLGSIIECSTYENELLPDDYIKNLESQYPPGTFLHKRMMLGMFGIASEGAIYDVYQPAIHLIDANDVPWDDILCWVGSVDLGSGGDGGDPFVYLQGFVGKTKNPDTGRNPIYITDEYYHRDGAVYSEHAKAIRARFRGGPIFRDYDGQANLEFKALGIKTTPANKSLHMGIQAVRTRLVGNDLFFVRGRTPNLLKELPFYIWTDGDKPKHKYGDHALDCLRYIVSALDLPPTRK